MTQFPHSQDSQVQESRGGKGNLVPLAAISSKALGQFLLHVLMTFSSTGLEVLVPEREALPPEATTSIPLN